MLYSSSHLVKTALNAETLDAAYVKYASFLKPWSKTTHFRDGSGETHCVLRPIKGNRVLHWHLQYAWNMSSSTAHETKLLDAEFDRSKTCFIISFSKWTKLVNRNIKLHYVSHKRSLSQSVSAFSCIYFTLMTIDVSCSSRIEKLPSSYSSESAEWKVLHEKKKKKKKKTKLLLLHLVNFTEFRPFYVRYYSLSSWGFPMLKMLEAISQQSSFSRLFLLFSFYYTSYYNGD